MSCISVQQAEAQDAARIYDLSRALIDRYEDTASIDYEAVLSWMRRKIERGIVSYTRILADGQGIGTQVLREILNTCRCDVMLYVFTRNARVMRWYERNGFRIDRQVSATRCIMVRKCR